jgi:hypothetical protein
MDAGTLGLAYLLFCCLKCYSMPSMPLCTDTGIIRTNCSWLRGNFGKHVDKRLIQRFPGVHPLGYCSYCNAKQRCAVHSRSKKLNLHACNGWNMSSLWRQEVKLDLGQIFWAETGPSMAMMPYCCHVLYTLWKRRGSEWILPLGHVWAAVLPEWRIFSYTPIFQAVLIKKFYVFKNPFF